MDTTEANSNREIQELKEDLSSLLSQVDQTSSAGEETRFTQTGRNELNIQESVTADALIIMPRQKTNLFRTHDSHRDQT